MKIDNTGTHIEYVENVVIQPSTSQKNALAFIDVDNQWVHIDLNILNSLYQFAVNQSVQKKAKINQFRG
jgi:hypothetical protein